MLPLEDTRTLTPIQLCLSFCRTVTLGTELLQERVKTLLIYPESLSPEQGPAPLVSDTGRWGGGTRGVGAAQWGAPKPQGTELGFLPLHPKPGPPKPDPSRQVSKDRGMEKYCWPAGLHESWMISLPAPAGRRWAWESGNGCAEQGQRPDLSALGGEQCWQ